MDNIILPIVILLPFVLLLIFMNCDSISDCCLKCFKLCKRNKQIIYLQNDNKEYFTYIVE